MSRVAKAPIVLPANIEVTIGDGAVTLKGPKGQLTQNCNILVSVTRSEEDKNQLIFAPASQHPNAWAQAGTMRALVNNMVIGVTNGFTRTLELHGVGYRAQAKDNSITLSLGFSHPKEFNLPEGIKAETPNNTTIILTGNDKQLLGKIAAEIRAVRPPEPYKGKGVRYAGEVIVRKEAKKK